MTRCDAPGSDLEAVAENLRMRHNRGSRHTLPFHYTGHPALALPVGQSSAGLPVSMQLVGRFFDDTLRMWVAYASTNTRPTGTQSSVPRADRARPGAKRPRQPRRRRPGRIPPVVIALSCACDAAALVRWSWPLYRIMAPRGLASFSETDNALRARRGPRSLEQAIAPAPWPKALHDVPEQHLRALHA